MRSCAVKTMETRSAFAWSMRSSSSRSWFRYVPRMSSNTSTSLSTRSLAAKVSSGQPIVFMGPSRSRISDANEAGAEMGIGADPGAIWMGEA